MGKRKQTKGKRTVRSPVKTRSGDTERKETESKLAYQASLLENINDAVIASDESYIITSWNRSAEEMYGWKAEEVIGRRAEEFLRTEYISDDPAEIGRTLTETGRYRGEWRQCCKDGRLIDVETTVIHLRDTEGRFNGYVGVNRDITERKRAEDKIAYQAFLLANVNDAVLASDAKFILTAWNRAAERIYGWKAEEVLGKSGTDILQTEFLTMSRPKAIKQLIETGEFFAEVSNLRKDGTRIFIETRTTAMRDPNGKTTGYITVNRDITERKRAEEELEEKQKFLKVVTQLTPDIVYLYHAQQHRHIYFNKEMAHLLGYSSEEIKTAGAGLLLNSIHPDDLPNVMRHIETLAHTPSDDSYRLEYRIKGKDGSYLWFYIREQVYQRDHAHQPEILFGNCQDITERKRAEEALRESTERFRSLSMSSPIGIFQTDAEGNCVYTNPRWQEITGLTLETSLGAGWTMAIHPDDKARIEAEWLRNAREYREFEQEFRFLRPNGEIRWVHARAAVMKNDYGQVIGYVGSDDDITDRKRAEEDVRRRADQFALLYQTSLDIIAPRDLDKLLNAIVERALKLIVAPGGTLYLYDAATQEVRCVISQNMPHDYVGTHLQSGEGVAGKTVQTGKPQIIDDYQTYPAKAAIYRDETTRALISIPLIWQGQVIGVLQAVDNTGRRQFTPVDQELLTLFANQATLAVANTRLLEAERTARSRAEMLATATAALAQTLDLDQVLDTLLKYLQLLVPYDSGNVMLMENTGEVVSRCIRGFERWMDPAQQLGKVFDLDTFIPMRQVIATRAKIVIEDTQTYPPWVKTPEGEHIRSWLGIPLVAGGQVIGLFALDKAEPNFFTDAHVQLAESLAAQAALAISNSLLFADAQRRWRELETLHQASLSFGQLQELPTVGESILKNLERMMNYERGAIVLRDEASGELQLLAHARMNLDETEYQKELGRIRGFFQLPQGITRWVAEHGKSIRTGDVRSDPRYLDAHPAIRSEMAVPLQVGTRTIGAINVESIRPDAFSEHDERLLSTIANVATVTIQNNMLFRSVKQQGEQLRALAGYLESAREDERTRIAREIHDEFGSALTALKIDLAWVAKSLTPQQTAVRQRVERMTHLIDASVLTVRRIATELRPGLLDDLGLSAAIEWQLREFADRTGIAYALDRGAAEVELERDLATAIFRTLQETLTNIARHAQATRVHVELISQTDRVTLIVRDNGKGIAAHEAADPKSLGLMGMRERAIAFGGEITVAGEPGQGTTVTMRVPRRPPKESA